MLTREKVLEWTGYRGEHHPNPVQEACFTPIFGSNLHVLVAAGTGCGKTLVYEWSIYKEVSQGRHVVLVAPQKALVEQKATAWRDPSHALSKYSLTVKTGDYLEVNTRDLVNNQIKILTPEALAVALRSRGSEVWLRQVSLLVIDEIHTLGMDTRGNGLEACIIGYFDRQGQDTRVVGVSASINDQSLHDMMEWMYTLGGKKVQAVKSPWRPTPLEHHFITYHFSKNYKKSEECKLEAVLRVVARLENAGKPALIFVHAKNFGYKLTETLNQKGTYAKFHCADLQRKERRAIEEEFLNGLSYLVATSTLAIGCDFAVEDVVVCGVHRGLSVVEQDTLQQMAGRAGHQSCCDKGVVHQIVPDTPDEEIGQWEDYIQGKYTITSELKKKRWLAFHSISVIANEETSTLRDMESWYKRTLAYVQQGEVRIDLMSGMIRYLEKAKAIRYVDEQRKTIEDGLGLEDEEFYATLLGRAAARFYFDPMDVYRWYSGMKKLSVRNHAQACVVLASGETLVGDLPVKDEHIPPAVEYGMYRLCSSDTLTVSTAAKFLYYLAHHLVEDNFKEREELPTPLKVPLPGFFKELQRITACLKYLVSQELDLEPNMRVLEDTVLKIIYGTPDEALDLLRIKEVGRARAITLYENGIRIIEDITEQPDKVISLLGPRIGPKVIANVQKIERVPF